MNVQLQAQVGSDSYERPKLEAVSEVSNATNRKPGFCTVSTLWSVKPLWLHGGLFESIASEDVCGAAKALAA